MSAPLLPALPDVDLFPTQPILVNEGGEVVATSETSAAQKTETKNKGLKIALIIIVALLVAGGIGFLIYWFLIRKKTNNAPTVSAFSFVSSSSGVPTTPPTTTPSSLVLPANSQPANPLYAYFALSPASTVISSGTVTYAGTQLASFGAVGSASAPSTDNNGNYWVPLTLSSTLLSAASPPASMSLSVQPSTGSAISATSSNELQISSAGPPSPTLTNFSIATNNSTPPTPPIPNLIYNNAIIPAPAYYAYFQLTPTSSTPTGTVVYNSTTVASIQSSSDYTTDGNGNFWAPLDLSSLTSSNTAPANMTLTVTTVGSSTSANTLAVTTTVPVPRDSGWFATTGGTLTKSNLVPTSSTYNVAQSLSSGNITFVSSGSFAGGSSTTALQMYFMSIEPPTSCSSLGPSIDYPFRMINTNASSKCYTGTMSASVEGTTICTSTVNFTIDQSGGGVPFLSSGSTYSIFLNDNSGCS